jgi:hypothetical protein
VQGEPGVGFESTGYISIPASAFVRFHYYDVNQISTYITNYDTTSSILAAPVQLPHGVSITNVTAYWKDADVNLDLYCRLYRSVGDGYAVVMAYVDSSGNSGLGSTVDTTIEYSSIVDNSQYSYSIYLVIPAGALNDLQFRFVTIGFAYPT